jgi:hypothetical protein
MDKKRTVDEEVQLDLSMLDQLRQVYYSRGVKGDARATLVFLKVVERRARLLGLDPPARQHIAVESAAGGVLVVPGMLDEEKWLAIAQAQQSDLLRREAEIWQRPPARRRRIVVDE